MRWWWAIGIFFFAGSIVAGWFGYLYYMALFSPNVKKDHTSILYIYPETDMDSLEVTLQEYIHDPASFHRAAKTMDFRSDDLKTGRYNLQSVQTNRELINILRAGREEPVNVVIHNEREVEQIAEKLSHYLLLDSLELLECFTTSPVLMNAGYTADSLLTLFIPNTYQVYWSTSCEKLAERLLREHDKFWEQSNRKEKATKIGMTPREVYTLASIVDRETLAPREKPTVARLYLNRLEKGIPLQADPTIVFANKIFDTRRVLYKHLELDSPYNTYLYRGLPPGPIGIASISGIDAVLNPDDNNYLYMVAKADNSGLHNFSTNLRQHNLYAKEYQRWLNQRGL